MNSAATTNIHPRPEADAQRDDIGGQHGGQEDAADHRRAVKRNVRPTSTICDRPRGSRHHAEIDREEHTDAISATFEVSKIPSHRMNSGTQADRGNGAQRLHRRIEQPPRQAPIAEMAPSSVPAATQDEARGDAGRCRDNVARQFAITRELDDSGEYFDRRRHQPALDSRARPRFQTTASPTGSNSPSAGPHSGAAARTTHSASPRRSVAALAVQSSCP